MRKTRCKTWMSICLLMLCFAVLLQGCGNKIDAIPDGSTITFDPASVIYNNISSDVIQNFTVTVRYLDGTPIPYAKIKVTGSFAIPNGMGLYQFYYYPDGTQNAGNIPIDSGFEAQTDKNGTYTFSVVVFGTSLFEKATIRAISGTVSGIAELSVTQT